LTPKPFGGIYPFVTYSGTIPSLLAVSRDPQDIVSL
jgi:hypothetical protein